MTYSPYESDKIDAYRHMGLKVPCFDCNTGTLKYGLKYIKTQNLSGTEQFQGKICTYSCDTCDYIYIDDRLIKQMKERGE